MRILPSSTGVDCDAVGSSFLLNVDVIQSPSNTGGALGLRRKVWLQTSSDSLDTGLIDFFITLKRARWRGFGKHQNSEILRTGIATATEPWFKVSADSAEKRGRAFEGTKPCILDGIGTEWFLAGEMHRHTAALPLTQLPLDADSISTGDKVLLDGSRVPSFSTK